MDVGVEGKSAVLNVKGKRVDVQVAGADHSDRARVVDHAIRMDMYIRHRWGCVFSQTVRQQQEHMPTVLEKCLHVCTRMLRLYVKITTKSSGGG